MLTYDLPLAEVIYDLHDKLKSATRGYGTMDYELIGTFPPTWCGWTSWSTATASTRCRVICDRADADRRGRAVVKKLKKEIDRHMFEVAVQAAIGSRVIARETVPAMRKNVTAKCYGGDITRKTKAVGQTARRQETDEVDRPSRHPAEGLYGRARYRQ